MTSPPVATDTAAADGVAAQRPEPAPRRSRRRWARAWLIACGVAVLVVAALLSAANTDGDSRTDLLHLIGAAGKDFASLRWQYTCVVVALAALHYVATAVAARAAAGIALPLGETLLVQLAAAAANRLTPAGLGASAVNARYFTRRGLDAPAALGAVAALSVLGAVADLMVLSALVLGGLWLGLSGGSQQTDLLVARVANLAAPFRSPWLWAAVVVGAGIALIWRRRKHSGRRRDWRQFWTPIRALLRRPSSLATLLTASGATTLILAFAFVASTAMVPGPRPAAGLGPLLIAFMVGAAAGSAVPVPAGIGSTETALAAVLIAMHVPAGHAIQEVLIFRVLTFWLPAIVGVLATRRLNRRHAI
jgi:uncharacterized membrane protein YbhN (UPF0104 family)